MAAETPPPFAAAICNARATTWLRVSACREERLAPSRRTRRWSNGAMEPATFFSTAALQRATIWVVVVGGLRDIARSESIGILYLRLSNRCVQRGPRLAAATGDMYRVLSVFVRYSLTVAA